MISKQRVENIVNSLLNGNGEVISLLNKANVPEELVSKCYSVLNTMHLDIMKEINTLKRHNLFCAGKKVKNRDTFKVCGGFKTRNRVRLDILRGYRFLPPEHNSTIRYILEFKANKYRIVEIITKLEGNLFGISFLDRMNNIGKQSYKVVYFSVDKTDPYNLRKLPDELFIKKKKEEVFENEV